MSLLLILRNGSSAADAYERFVAGCAAPLVREAGSRRTVVDSGRFRGSSAAAKFKARLGTFTGREGLFVGLCHGTEDALCMPGPRPCIDTASAGLLRNKFCYAVACSSATRLGPAASGAGALGYVGFSDGFWVVPVRQEVRVREALVSGAIEYLRRGGTPQQVARVLEDALRGTADDLASGNMDPHLDACVIGHLLRCANAVRYC